MSLQSPKFFIATNTFETLIWYCSVPSFTFGFLTLNHSIPNFCFVLWSLTVSFNFCNGQKVISITGNSSGRSDITYTPIYRGVISQALVYFWAMRLWSAHLDRSKCNYKYSYCALDNESFRCGKVHYSETTIITVFVETLFPKSLF
jgi:hypothetical protein